MKDGSKNRDAASQLLQSFWFDLKDTLIRSGYFDVSNPDDWRAVDRVTQAVLTFAQDMRNK